MCGVYKKEKMWSLLLRTSHLVEEDKKLKYDRVDRRAE